MARNDLQEWNRNLGQVSTSPKRRIHSEFTSLTLGHFLIQLKIERKSGDAALLSMTENVATRLDVKSRKSSPPFFRLLSMC